MITQMLIAGGGFLPESKAYFDAMAVQLNGAEKSVVNTFISALKSSGAWPYIGGMWISSLVTEQQTFLNLVNPTDSDTTRIKIGSPTFTSGVGWTGTGSNANRLSTNGNATNAKFKLQQQDHMFLSYVSDNGMIGTRMVMGLSTNRHGIMPERTAGVLSGYMGRNSPIGGGGGTTVNEVKIAMRASSSDARVISNKTLYGSDTTAASDVIPSTPVHFLTNNNSWAGNSQTRLEAVGQGSMPDATRESMVDAINNFIIQWDAI